MTAVQPLGEFAAYTYATATNFQISARAPDLRALPFPAVFSPSSAAPGQMISVGATAYASTGGYPYSLPTSITLNPQTIDAVVIAVSTSGPYTVLTVGLAPYDPIVQMNMRFLSPPYSNYPGPTCLTHLGTEGPLDECPVRCNRQFPEQSKRVTESRDQG
jgi:hypothetical protein